MTKADIITKYCLALKLVAQIDTHLTNRTRHYRNKAGELLTSLDQIINAILNDELREK